MATEGAHRIRKDFKFETFLKRSLDPEEFERVRFYDFCVVTSRTESRAYKYVVLTDEWIYLTENPPKTITRFVHLRDVEGIEWMRDFPDFLEGDVKKNAQHICVRYRYEAPARGRAAKKESARTETDGAMTARSTRSDFNNTDRSAGLATARPEERKKGVVPRLRFEDEAGEAREAEETREVAEHQEEPKPVPQVRSAGCCRAKAKQEPLQGEGSAVPESARELINESTQEEGPPPSARYHIDIPTSTPRRSFRESVRSGNSSTRTKLVSLHLYLMNSDTPALLLFCTAWNAFMLRGTRLLDAGLSHRCAPRGKPLQDEALAFLFARLKTELLESANDLGDCFDLTNELFNATQRHFGLKKQFWRTPELFAFLVGRLRALLPRSQLNFREPEARFQRADEVEFCALLLDTLNLMLQQTETMAARNNCLRYRNGKELLELVDLVVSEPALPEPYEAMSSAASKLLNMRETELALRKVDREFKQLREELVSSGASLLYELLLTSRISSEGPKDALPTESVIVRRVEAAPSVQRFLKAFVEQALGLIAPSNTRRGHLSPLQAVEAFQHFSVLASLASLSRALKLQLREDYMEEFRYFVQAPVVLQRLCKHYPITWPTLTVIEEVTSLVTGRERIFDAEDDREEEEEEECEG